MSNAKKVTQDVGNYNEKAPVDSLIDNKGNLVHLDDNKQRSNPNELNSKINHIDTSLDALTTELNTINEDVKESLERLTDEGTDLTTKVATTYKQIGDLEQSYTFLSDKSSQIKEEINSVSSTLNALSDKSGSDIEKLSEGYDGLFEKTQELVKKSRKTARTLNKSIKDNAVTMKLLEERLSLEIESLATTTQNRDDALEKDLQNQQARLLQLQDVDKALGKRATTLEQATDDLRKESKELAKSHNLLNRRSNDLAADISELQKQASEQHGLIHTIQDNVSSLSDSLFDLAKLEKKRFIGITSTLAVLILALAAFFFYQQSNWKAEGKNTISVQTEIQTIHNKLLSMDDRVQKVDDHVQGVDQHVQNVDDRVQNMDDSAKTLDGRINALMPSRQFGVNNTIHGPHWLAKQTDKQFVIQLALVSDKQSLYQIASQYSFYLKDELAFVPVGTDKYMLVYGGYKNQYAAQLALGNLPAYIKFERPVIHRMVDIQAQLLSLK